LTAVAEAGEASWTTTAIVTEETLSKGERQSVTATIKSDKTIQANVVIELYDPNGDRISVLTQQNSSFIAGNVRTFRANWTVPTNAANGTYTIGIGLYSRALGSLLSWNDSAVRFTVD